MRKECPGQDALESAVEHSLTDDKYEEYFKSVRRNNRVLGVDAALKEYDIDVIMGAPTGRCATIYDMAGYPIGTLPLGYARFNGRPFGMACVAPANREDLIVRVMSAWEATLGPRKPPPQLVNWTSSGKSSL
jgi:amidase